MMTLINDSSSSGSSSGSSSNDDSSEASQGIRQLQSSTQIGICVSDEGTFFHVTI
jgi:hypothetical protein